MSVELNMLPRWSSWPSRLLKFTSWEAPMRTLEKIDQEYERHKWARCLKYYEETEAITPEDLKRFELIDRGVVEPLCFSRQDTLVTGSIDSVIQARQCLIVESMQPFIDQDDTVVELGCGYGYNLWQVRKAVEARSLLGGDYSGNAIGLGSRLFENVGSMSFSLFNFYDRSYQILQDAPGPVVVFTAQAIEQLPVATCFFDALERHRHKIKAVFHFEPVYGLYDETTLMGLMRKRYTQVNDYNRDLLAELASRADSIHLVSVEKHALGLNPLNPLSVLHWEYWEGV